MGCNRDKIAQELPQPTETAAQTKANQELAAVAKALTRALGTDAAARPQLKAEALKKFDGDYDVLYQPFAAAHEGFGKRVAAAVADACIPWQTTCTSLRRQLAPATSRPARPTISGNQKKPAKEVAAVAEAIRHWARLVLLEPPAPRPAPAAPISKLNTCEKSGWRTLVSMSLGSWVPLKFDSKLCHRQEPMAVPS